MTVQALFVDAKGIYPELLGRTHCWAGEDDYERWPWAPSDDAREYAGPDPVVAHPPCHLWVNMAAVNWKRYRRERPAWYPNGSDGGCFAAAWEAVKHWGGVLEHPANTHAPVFSRQKPLPGSWQRFDMSRVWSSQAAWVCEVWQSAYGHAARKRTWLLYCGTRPPFELNWARNPGTHQVGWFDRNKPTVSKREASATPEAFARELVRLAEWSRS